MVETFTFGKALETLIAGGKVARLGWNGEGMFLAMQTPDEHSKMKSSYIYISPVDGNLVPWVASQSDILSDDWYTINA